MTSWNPTGRVQLDPRKDWVWVLEIETIESPGSNLSFSLLLLFVHMFLLFLYSLASSASQSTKPHMSLLILPLGH